MEHFRSFPVKNKRAGPLLPHAWGNAARSSRSSCLQETPMGSFMLVWFEAPDIAEVFTNLASLNTEFTTWFRTQVKDLTGVDLGAPPEGPPPDVLVDCAP
jgi:hypothetical protein